MESTRNVGVDAVGARQCESLVLTLLLLLHTHNLLPAVCSSGWVGGSVGRSVWSGFAHRGEEGGPLCFYR